MKFHWKPVAGVHSLVWEEAQIAAGVDPDFHRRDLADAHRGRRVPRVGARHPGAARTPTDETFEGIDLLDPTKLVPGGAGAGAADRQADAEPQPDQLLRRDRAGRLPHRQPGAGHRGHQRPAAAGRGCSPTSTPSSPGSAARTSPSCRSTGRTRRSTTCCATACTRRAIHTGVAPYRPNSIDGGYPFAADARPTAATCRRAAAGRRRRRSAAQPGVLRRPLLARPRCSTRSLTAVEQEHIVEAFTFELGKCYEQAIKERELERAGQHRRRPVRAGRRRARPAGAGRRSRPPTSRRRPRCRRSRRRPVRSPAARSASSPAPAPTWPASRKLREALAGAGRRCWSSPRIGGSWATASDAGGRRAHLRHRPVHRVRRDRRRRRRTDGRRHQARRAAAGGVPALKALGAWGDGVQVLAAAGIEPDAPGVLTGQESDGDAGRRPDRRPRAAPGLGPHTAGGRLDVPPSV